MNIDTSALNKAICMRCHSEYFDSKWLTKNNEYLWNNDFVVCPNEYNDYEERPPKNCPYRLEHMLATQKKPVSIARANDE